MSGICYIIAEQYWEAWGLFWKRSVSLCFLGVLFGFGCWVVCVVVCSLVFCVCWWHLDHCLTFSLLRGNRQSKQDVLMTVWASSAHGTGKKKRTQEFSFKVKRWQVDQSGCCPILQSRTNVDRFTFDPQMFTPLFPRLYDGILYDVFIQKAALAWVNAPNSRIMVSLLLPGPMEADQWLHKVSPNRYMWPFPLLE